MCCVKISDPPLLCERSNSIEVPNIKVTKQRIIFYTTTCKTIQTKRLTLGERCRHGGARGCKAGERERKRNAAEIMLQCVKYVNYLFFFFLKYMFGPC